MMALRSHEALRGLGLPATDAHDLPTSARRFEDGAHYRVEISSVEGPRVLVDVLDEAAARNVPVHRVSQGSGIFMLDDDEIREMVQLGHRHGVEINLFVGPRAAWDIGVQATSLAGRSLGAALRGCDQLAYGLEDVFRGVDLGLRSVLVGDLGQLAVLGRLRRSGDLPEDMILKTSVSLPVGNPASAYVLAELGADSINLPVDLTLSMIAAIRAAVDVPLDIYLEAPDEFGGVVRHYETPEIVRVAAPVYVKYAVRNAAPLYPVGAHTMAATQLLGRERVRRAAISLRLLRQYMPEAISSSVVGRFPERKE